MSLPEPLLKRRVPPPPPEAEGCGCCDGVGQSIPLELGNRDGLSAINYRIGDHARFRDSLHALLSSQQFEALDGLRTRDDDDFTIGLIDAFSCAADVLTFYQERIANESYLRTAGERVSLQELGKLVGYRLRPGVAAETWLAFALESPPEPPPDLVPEPGNFVTGVPRSMALANSLKVQSVPGPGERPQTFETVEELSEARPEWNAIRPWLTRTVMPGRNDQSTVLAGVRDNLRPGDALLFLGDEYLADTNDNNWDFRVIDAVEADANADRTIVRWKRGLGSIDPYSDPAVQNPQVHVLRRRAAVFGHNSPAWTSMVDDIRNNFTDWATLTQWPGFILSPSGSTADGGHVDTDALYSEARNGSFVVLAKGGFDYANEPAPSGTYVELYRVANIAEVSRADFAMSGKVSRLQLRGENYALFESQVRETAVFLQSEQLAFAPYPVTDPVQGDRLPAKVDAEGLQPGRRLMVRGKRVKDGKEMVVQAKLLAIAPVGQGRCQLTIHPPLVDPLRRDTVVIYANVALASHGESVSQLLGSGNSGEPFQRFELKHSPLTHRAAENDIGAAAELEVRVGDVRWHERRSLYRAGPTDRAYTLAADEHGALFVRFGDGISGARLPTSANNVRAAYRKGLGAGGNVGAGKLTQLMSRPLGLKSVSNPLPAEGGADPERGDAARRTIPLGTRTLGRAVSLLDYEDYARAFSGVAKARAQVIQSGSERAVAITIAGPDGKSITPASPTWTNLLASLRDGGDPFVTVQLLQHQASTFRIGLKVKCHPDRLPQQVLANVETKLRAAFSFDRRELGQPVQQSEVIAVAQGVTGVVAVDLVCLYGGSKPPAQTTKSLQPRLLASRMRIENGTVVAAEILLLDPGPLDQLEVM